ncbi:MAG: autotransporter-associated beta strand repeat-containing protein [Candidatus Accumulibacter sp.]|nr:autotransporter-associated beta strand repeat-containing protein [Accumulibacter sp.]
MNGDGVYIGTARLGDGQLEVYQLFDPGSASIGNLQLEGRGVFTDADNLATVGSLSIDGGTLHDGNWSGLVERTYTTPEITLGSGGATVELNAGEDKDLGRALIGSGGLTKTGAGTLTLSGANLYTGNTAINVGTLEVTGSLGAWDGGTSTYVYAGNITNNATLVFRQSANQTLTTGVISGSGSLTKQGNGTLTLSGANTYTGMTTVEGGTLALTITGTISDKLTLHDGANFNNGGSSAPFWNGASAQANLAQLDVHGSATYDGSLNVAGGEMNFYVPSTMSSGTLLNVNGNADISGAIVNVGVAGSSSPLAVGNQITFLDATGTLNATGVVQGTGVQGVTLKYEFGLEAVGQQLLATVTSAPTLNERTKSLSEGYLSGTSFLSQGSDFLLGKGVSAARTAVAEGSQNSPEVFAALGYGKVHNQTGSSVAVKGYNLVTGLAFGKRLDSGELTAAAFFEYGNGDYNAYNSVSGGKVKGRGDTGYKGIGLLTHYRLANGLMFEASARTGRVDTDYRSDDLRDANGTRARYDAKSGYTSAHVGVGKDWTLNTQNDLETYVKGIWTRQASDKVRLSTGDRVEFDKIDSKRIRIGARLTHTLSSSVKAYAGVAFDREFDGEAKATTSGQKIDAPKLKGNTGIGEIGITATPTAGKPLFLDFGVQGYAGKREGVTGSLRVNYFF